MRICVRKLSLGWFFVCGLLLGTNVLAGDAIGIHSNIDIRGGDYRSIKFSTFDQCLNLCAAEKRCAAFTFNQGARVCFLKERVGQKTRFVGARSGVKKTKNIAGSINATRMEDACSFDPANIDTAITVFRDGVVPTGFDIKNRVHYRIGSTEIKYWRLSQAADLHLLFVRTGKKRHYWCSDDRAGNHGSWTLDEKFSDFEKGYFTLNILGCSGTGIGCSTASVYRIFGNSLSKPIHVGTHSYAFASYQFLNHELEFKIAEIRCAKRHCSVYGDGFIEISHTWDGYSERQKRYVVTFESKDFFSGRVDYRQFDELSQIVNKHVGGERPISPEAFSRMAQKVYNSYGVAYPGTTFRIEGR